MQKKSLIISQKGIELIKSFEGLHDGNKSTDILEPQKDPVGYWTLGYGSRTDINGKTVTEKTAPITVQDAVKLLIRDIGIASAYVNSVVKTDLNQNQFDAVCSLVFNIGTGNFQKSLLLKALNGAMPVKESHFSAWRKAKGVVLPGLVARRAKEYALYRTPV